MRSRIILPIVFLIVGWLSAPVQAEGDSDHDKILAGFAPYRYGPVRVEGVSPGMTLNSTNAQAAASVLPPEVQKYLLAGDFSVTVQETTNMPVRQSYIDATLQHYNSVVVGEEELQGYVAGRPFPLLDPQDPQVGLKAVWNLRYRDQGETAQMWSTNSLLNESGGVERSQSFLFMSMYGMHRPEEAKNIPEWERRGIYSKQYNLMLAPSDSEGNQIVSVTYNNTAAPQDQWAYDPKTRRTRRLIYNPYISPEGGVSLIEDRSGFFGYIHHYDWKYIGEQIVLAPGPIRAAEPTWGGKGSWYPVDPWELRRAIVLESRPKSPHPLYSRRMLYLDVQTSVPLYAITYDHTGNHKRTFILVYRHPEFNPWNNTEWFAQTAAQSSIDYQVERANVFRVTKIWHNRPLSTNRFDVMALLLYGR